MENIKELLKIKVWDRKKYYVACFIFLTFILEAEKRFNGFPKKYILGMTIVTFLIIFFWNKSIEKNTLLLSVVFSLSFAFISPVFDVWDETSHFARVEYISEGHLFLTNNKEDHVITKDQKKLEKKTQYLSKKKGALPNLFKLKLWQWQHDPETEYSRQVPVTNAYGTISYLPAVLGYNIGKVISNNNLGVMFYMGRVFNALFYSLCAFFAMKLAGKWRYVLAFFALQPVVIYAAGSYNQDAFSYGILLLVVSLFFKMVQQEDTKLNYRQLSVFIGLCMILAFCKLPYIILAGLIFFIPYKKYKDKKMYAFMLIGIILVILVSLFWFIQYSKITGAISTNKHADSAKQIAYISTHFSKFLKDFFYSIFQVIGKYNQLSSFGWDFRGSNVLALINLIFIGIVFSFPLKGLDKVSRWTKFGVVFLSLLITIGIYLSMYITWTNVGENYVSGVQGRYFVGILMLMPVVCNYSKYIGNITMNKYTLYTPQVMAFILLIWSIATRISRYY